MKVFSGLTNPNIAYLLRQGAVGIIPTDTIYGIVARAGSQEAVERLYKIRSRNPHKACILLIAKRAQITHSDILAQEMAVMQQYWPGPVSIILPASGQTPYYLHRGQQGLAYRMPDFPALQVLLQQTGPLVAPSANPEGHRPASTLAEAQTYFGDNVDFYVDGGKLVGKPSRLIKIEEDRVINLR